MLTDLAYQCLPRGVLMPGGDDRLIPLAAETHKRITAPFLPKYTFATPKDRNLAGVFAVGDVYARDSLLDACENKRSSGLRASLPRTDRRALRGEWRQKIRSRKSPYLRSDPVGSQLSRSADGLEVHPTRSPVRLGHPASRTPLFPPSNAAKVTGRSRALSRYG